MAQVAQQAIADVQSRMGNATQRQAQRHTRRGQFHAQAAALECLAGEQLLATEHLEGQACIAHGAAHINVIVGLCAMAQQGLLGRHFAKHGDADVQRALGGVPPDQLAAVRIGQGQQAL